MKKKENMDGSVCSCALPVCDGSCLRWGAAGFAGDKEDRVVDGADLLSDIEETELREKA